MLCNASILQTHVDKTAPTISVAIQFIKTRSNHKNTDKTAKFRNVLLASR